jgi:NAD(P)-dependent dehydrogenase (short-subunit alcohol dehydrogenase family)
LKALERAVEFENKVVIITGASVGIGRAYALAFAGAGATVIAVARSIGSGTGAAEPGTLAEVVEASAGLPGRVYALSCDVEVEADIARVALQTAANFGRIDVLINNAGIYPHYDALSITPDEWDLNMRVNVRGPYLMMKHVAPHMIRKKSGSVITLTSASANPLPAGHPGNDDLGLYGVTKAAVNRLTTFMAEYLRPHGIAVNAISPGMVYTDTWQNVDPEAVSAAKEAGMGKPPTPEVMGPAMMYLAKQTSQTMTGEIVHTDTFRKTWPAELISELA